MVPSAVTGWREEGDILYVASAKRSSGRPAAAATGSAAKQVGFANREGLSGKDSKLQNRKDSDALLPSYDADKWQHSAMTDSSKNERSGLSSDEHILPGMHSKSGVANVGSAEGSPASANVFKEEI